MKEDDFMGNFFSNKDSVNNLIMFMSAIAVIVAFLYMTLTGKFSGEYIGSVAMLLVGTYFTGVVISNKLKDKDEQQKQTVIYFTAYKTIYILVCYISLN